VPKSTITFPTFTSVYATASNDIVLFMLACALLVTSRQTTNLYVFIVQSQFHLRHNLWFSFRSQSLKQQNLADKLVERDMRSFHEQTSLAETVAASQVNVNHIAQYLICAENKSTFFSGEAPSFVTDMPNYSTFTRLIACRLFASASFYR
jgi:hypothetical protein